MAIIDNDVRPPSLVMNHVDSLKPTSVDFSPVYWTPEIAVPEHAESYKGQSDAFGKEDFANGSWDLGEGISDTSYDDILECCGVLNERRTSSL